MNDPAYRPSRAVHELGSDFYDPVAAASFPQHILRFRNDRHAATVGLAALSDDDWLAHFGRFEPLPRSLETPLALRYHGHQFRTYNPDLGDGRGFLFAQLHDDRGRLLDLGTKGSGQTPWSRFGDGRLTLKGGMREVLATEMLEALGVDTSKSFSLIETGEALTRGDEPSPTRSAVLVRLSHSHIRYGSFQRLAYLKDNEGIERLTDYVLRHYVPGGAEAPDRYAALMEHAVTGAARLAAGFMAAGFVHGVLNTDNINITGESFDYGPYRFAPRYDPSFTAAYFDHSGLYAFGRQAEALHWNVHQLALALRTVAETDCLVPAFRDYPARFEAELRAAVLKRLGVVSKDEASDLAVMQAMESALEASGLPLDRFYFDWRGGRRRGESPAEATYALPAFAIFVDRIASYEPAADLSHPYWADADPCALLIDEIESIWAAIAERDDWALFHAKIAAIRRMGAAMTAKTGLS
ncbi:protein adenylyltransferase SelO [Sphingoaurantiacus capsulatus]|uniref:Protein nucleotidyltransferase YdiU n=1 Tax=Sphingoaurantiacus capsulatus TaxID=1771310 RepID=A0ABV7XAV4_9SPHN